MAETYKGITIKFEGDATDLQAKLNQIRESSTRTYGALRNINKGLKFDPSSTLLLTQKQANLQRAIRDNETRIQAYRSAMEELEAREAANGSMTEREAAQYEQLARSIEACERQNREYARQLADVTVKLESSQTRLGQFATAAETVGTKLKGAGERAAGLGDKWTRSVTTPLVAGGAIAIKAATDLDTSYHNLTKTVDGTDEELRSLKDRAIELSKVQPVDANTIMNIEALGAQLGYSNSELEGFAQTVSGLDIATDMDFETAATQLAQFSNIMGMSHEETSNYGSAIVDLGNHFSTTESSISNMALRIAAAGKQAGMSEADVLGLATALSSMGIEAEAGGTAISTIMSNIDKDVATGSDRLETWASTAQMSAEQFASAWKTNPVEALSAVLSGMESATNEGGNMAVMLDELGISSIRQTDTMKRLAGNSSLVADAVGTANTAWRDNTALANEVNNRNDSLASKFGVLRNRATAVAAEVGGPLADALIDALEAAKPLFDAIEGGAKAFAEMDTGTQRLIVGIVGLVAALGPVLSIGGRITQVVGTLVGGAGKAAGAMSSFQVAMKATDAATIKSLSGTDNLAVKLGLAKNEAVKAAGGIGKWNDALAEGVKTAREQARQQVRQTAGFKNLVTEKQIEAEATKAADAAEKQYLASANASTVAMNAQSQGAATLSQRVASAASSFVSFAGIAATAVTAGVAIQEIAKGAAGFYENQAAAEAASGAFGHFAQAAQNAHTSTTNLDLAMSSGGQSITTLKGITSDAFTTIRDVIEENMSEAGVITEDGAERIREAMSAAMSASRGEAEAYASAIDTMSNSIGESLNTDQLAQYVSDVQGTYDEGKKALQDNLSAQLQAIETYHQQVGDVGSAAYNQEKAAAQEAYNQQLAILDEHKNQAMAKTGEMYQGMDKATADGWANFNQKSQGWKNDWSRFWSDSWAASSTYTWNIENDFNSMLGTMDTATTGAWMAAQLATVEGGGKLSDETKQQVNNIIGTFDGLPVALSDEGTAAMRSLGASIEAGGVELGDISNMSGQQIVDAIKAKMGEAAEEGHTGGQNTANNIAAGMNEGQPNVDGAAQNIAGTTRGADVSPEGFGWGSTLAGNLTGGLMSGRGGVQGAAGGLNSAQGAADASGQGGGWGSSLAGNLAGGLNSGRGEVSGAASGLASAQDNASRAGDGWSWGNDLASNIAGGLRAGISAVSSAASAVASAISGWLHQSVADYGPLHYTDVWGVHLVENIAEGMEDSIPELHRSVMRVASEIGTLSDVPVLPDLSPQSVARVERMGQRSASRAAYSAYAAEMYKAMSRALSDSDLGVTTVNVNGNTVNDRAGIMDISREYLLELHRKGVM